MELEYNNRNMLSPFYGNYGKMTVSNSGSGVLIQHEKEFYDFEEKEIGRKVVKDICNSLRSEYEPSLTTWYTGNDKKVFNGLLDCKIEDAEKLLNDLKFAKVILSRKKVIFERQSK